MGHRGETVAFVAVLLSASAAAVAARWVRRTDALPDLPGWALADRSWGAVVTWFLLGGSIFTAGFTSVVGVGSLQLYVALVALAANLVVAAVATVLLDRRGVPRERPVVVT